jgi:ubiquinone biosynthesis protein
MKRPAQLLRIIYINFVIARYGLDRYFYLASPLFYPFRFLSYLNPWYWINKKRGLTRGECLRLALEDLGPIFVKFGQILSTRQDLLPDDVAVELEKLQDKVPPFSSELAKKTVEKAYQKPLTEIFSEFDLAPLASASIAQVHAGVLLDGK